MLSRFALGFTTALLALMSLGAVTALAAPGNDNYASFITLTITGDSTTPVSSNVDATTEASEQLTVPIGMSSANTGKSVWYAFTAPTSGAYVIDTCNTEGISSFDTVLSVYSNPASVSAAPLVSSDDDCGAPSQQSSVTFTASGAGIYRVRVASYNGSSEGQFKLRVRTVPFRQSPPLVTGSPLVGGQLHTDPGSWNGAQPITVTKSWYRCTNNSNTASCTIIAGQNGAYYTPVAADLGTFIRSAETATNALGQTTSNPVNFSDPTAVVQNPPVPSNDNFISATDLLSVGFFSVTSHNVGATIQTDEIKPLLSATGSVWYRWTAPVSARYTFSLCGAASFDTVLGVFTGGSVTSLTPVAADDDGCGGNGVPSKLVLDLVGGTTYAISVAGYQGASGGFTLTMTTKPYVVNAPQAFGSFLLGSSPLTRTLATWGGPGPITSNGSWQRCTNKTMTASCSPIAGANGPIYETTSDDLGKYIRFAESATNSDGTSEVVFSSSAIGPIHELAIPPNDNFEDATTVVTGSSTAGSNPDSTSEGADPNPVGPFDDNSVWYNWTPSFTGQARIGLCDADFDSVLGVYTGATLGALAPVATADDGCGTAQAGSRLTTAVVAGTTYRILVAGTDEDAWGQFTLQIENVTPAADPPASSGGGTPATSANPVSFTVPTAKASKLTAKVKKRALTIPGTKVACAASATGACTGTVALSVKVGKKTVKLSIKLSFKTGSNGGVVLKLSKSNAKKLAKAKKSAATAVLKVGSPGFAAKTTTVKFTLSG